MRGISLDASMVGICNRGSGTPDTLSRSRRNTFAELALDRAGPRRLDAEWLQATLARPGTRVVPILGGKHPILMGRVPQPVFLPAAGIQALENLEDHLVFLGEWQEVAYFSVDLTAAAPDPVDLFPSGHQLLGLREVGAIIDAHTGALFAYTQAMRYWHRRHRYCGDCGSPTRSSEGGICACVATRSVVRSTFRVPTRR